MCTLSFPINLSPIFNNFLISFFRVPGPGIEPSTLHLYYIALLTSKCNVPV